MLVHSRKQVRFLGKFFSLSFLWGFFQWFFAATETCGFSNFPTFGLKAYQNKSVTNLLGHLTFINSYRIVFHLCHFHRFYFDFSATYVGVGMICPYVINVSMLLGAVLSWGIMWPLIEKKEGDWYSAHLSSSSLNGLQGYRVTFLVFANQFHIIFRMDVISC